MIVKKLSKTIITKKDIRFSLVFGVLILFAIFFGPVQAVEEDEIKPMQTSLTANVVKKVFPNGLTLLIKANHDHDLITVNLFTRMGVLYEAPSQKGISSLMQRCLLYGGTTNRQPHIVYRDLELVGAHWNSSSSADYGNVWLTVTKPGFERALDVYLDLIRHPKFAARDLKVGKREWIEKIKTWDDQPFNTASSLFSRGFFGEHPYGWLNMGSIESIEGLTRADLKKWYKKVYIPNNMVFTVVGNVNPDEVIAQFEEAFSKMKRGRLPEKSSRLIPALEEDIVHYQPRDVQGAYLILGYPAPSDLSAEGPAMEVLNTILGGGGMGNRLFSEIRDKQGLVYIIQSSYQQMVGPSIIIAATLTTPENYQVVRDGIVAEFKRFCDEPVSPAELQATKKWMKGTYALSQETYAAQGRMLGIYELFGYGYQYVDEYPKLIEAVEPEDIQRVAEKYFNHYVLAVLAPEGSIENE